MKKYNITMELTEADSLESDKISKRCFSIEGKEDALQIDLNGTNMILSNINIEKTNCTKPQKNPNESLYCNNAKRYGIRIFSNGTKPEYLYDAVGMKPAKMNFETGEFDYGDWKDIWFVKYNKPVMLKFNGQEIQTIERDYDNKIDLSSVIDIMEKCEGLPMVRIPPIYLQTYITNYYIDIIVSKERFNKESYLFGVNDLLNLCNPFNKYLHILYDTSHYKENLFEFVYHLPRALHDEWAKESTRTEIRLFSYILCLMCKDTDIENTFGVYKVDEVPEVTIDVLSNITTQFDGSLSKDEIPRKLFYLYNLPINNLSFEQIKRLELYAR